MKKQQSLNTADGSKMKIIYKLSNAFVCKRSICINTTFIMIKNLSQFVILGTSFLSLIEYFSVDSQGIHTKLYNQHIIFGTKNNIWLLFLMEKILMKTIFLQRQGCNTPSVISVL